jgi:hypothetical protein
MEVIKVLYVPMDKNIEEQLENYGIEDYVEWWNEYENEYRVDLSENREDMIRLIKANDIRPFDLTDIDEVVLYRI